MTETLEKTLTAYDAWLDRQPLAAKTRTAYRLQVHQYGAYLARRLCKRSGKRYWPEGRANLFLALEARLDETREALTETILA